MSIADFINRHGDVLTLTPSNRVRCLLSGHEMPLRMDVLQQYINSSKLKKLKEWYSFDFSKYQPHIVPHHDNDKKLFCKLTKLTLNKIPEEVENHVNGKKFLRLKMEYDEKQSKKAKHQKSTSVEGGNDEDFWMPDDDFEGDEEEEQDGGEDSALEEDSDDLADLIGDEEDYVVPKGDDKGARGGANDVGEDDDSEIDDFIIRKKRPVTKKESKLKQKDKVEQKRAKIEVKRDVEEAVKGTKGKGTTTTTTKKKSPQKIKELGSKSEKSKTKSSDYKSRK